MPSAGDVVGDGAAALRPQRPPGPRRAAPRGAPPGARRRRAGPPRPRSSATSPSTRRALSTVVVGYYTDKDVRELIGYPGQEAKTLYSWKVPDFIEEGLIDRSSPAARCGATPRRAAAPRPADPVAVRRRAPWSPPHSTSWLDPFLAAWRPGTGEPREIREPATGRPLLTVAQSTPDDVARGPPATRPRPSPPGPRRATTSGPRILRRAAEIYEAHRPEFGTWTQRETGAVHSKMHHEQNFAVGEIHAAATMPFQPYGQLVPSVVPGRLSMLRRVPAGVIGAITPWNSPSVLGMRVVAPALALGNAVILKPDPQTPVCGGAMFEAVFREAGLPEGLLQVVLGGADVGEAIVTDPNVTRVSFTGSTAAGRRVGALAGRAPQAGLARARRQQRVRRPRRRRPRGRGLGRRVRARSSSRARSASRPGATSSTAASPTDYVDLLVEKAQRLRLGDPYREDVDLGPIVNEKQLARVDDIVRRSVEGGARVVTGGAHDGLFYRPTVLTDVTTEQAAWREEIFGPVAPVVVVRRPTRRRSRSRTTASTGSRAPSTRGRSRAASRSPSGSGAAWSTSTTRR